MSTDTPIDPIEELKRLRNYEADLTGLRPISWLDDIIAALEAERAKVNDGTALGELLKMLEAERATRKRVAEEMRQRVGVEGLIYPYNVIMNWADELWPEGT